MLAGMRRVHVRYHPQFTRNRVALEFITRAQGRRAVAANPGCEVKVELYAKGPPQPPTINIEFENSEVVTFDASKMSMKEIAEEVKDAQEHIDFQLLRQEYAEEQDDEEDTDGWLTAWNPNENFDDAFSVEEVRTGKMMNHQRNPTAVARRKFEAELATYQSLQRKLAAVEARAKLDPSLAQLLASAKKSLAAEDAKWNDWAAKMKASEPASKAAHSKAPAKKPAAK